MTFKYVTELVQEVIREYPEAKKNKKILVTKVWEKQQGLYLSDEQFDLLMKVSTPETITRCLRKLIEEDKVKTTMGEHIDSQIKEKAFVEHFSKPKEWKFDGNRAWVE